MLVLATQSGIARYDTVSFTAHVVQHVLLGIVAPFFLALGAPVTLALQAAHRPTQVNLVRVLHSRPVAILSHPLVAGALFALSLFLLYFSPLYELSLRNEVVHAWVHVHFLVVGCLFFWVAIGLDPSAHRVPYGARLLLVLLTVPFHAFLGLALMSTQHPLAESYYAGQDRTGQVAILDDQHDGAALMWAVGELVALGAGGVILVQWSAHEQRETRRLDRRLDALELAAHAGRP
jgi:putative copper resistance protein D